MRHDENNRLARTIEDRTGVGPSEMVAGWQAMLTKLVVNMEPFLTPGAVVTFQSMTPDESSFFSRIADGISVQETVVAFYLPPSVRHHMMGGDHDLFEPDRQVDSGALIACQPGKYDTIVNALFAHPPFTPAVDVYESGQLTAGYQYGDVDQCIAELGAILARHLQPAERMSAKH